MGFFFKVMVYNVDIVKLDCFVIWMLCLLIGIILYEFYNVVDIN